MEQKEFEIEVGRIRPHLHSEALRYLSDSSDAEDIVQEVVLKLWLMRDRLEEYRSTEALAVVMARRLCLNRLRGTTCVALDSMDSEVAAKATPESELISHEDAERAWLLMDSLPDAQQTVLRMKHVERMEVAEIARVTGSTPEAVRQNLSRARRNILKRFTGKQ